MRKFGHLVKNPVAFGHPPAVNVFNRLNFSTPIYHLVKRRVHRFCKYKLSFTRNNTTVQKFSVIRFLKANFRGGGELG
jgi:hypothetical protein